MESTSVIPTRSTDISLESSTFRKSNISKLDHLYEIEYFPESDKIETIDLPLVNPYSTFSKNRLRSTKTSIKNAQRHTKEYVQSTKSNMYPIFATEIEQFITLAIPSEFPRHWITNGYTHIHFGAIRLALSYSKGLHVTTRIALLDTRYLKYQDASIGTVETTLNAGTIFVTLFPNSNMSLQDPRLLSAIKVQLQIVEPPQVTNAVVATLHYQMVYRIQNHALDLALPQSTMNETLLISVNLKSTPNCVHVPRQISRVELVKLLPEIWVTNYEWLHQNTRPGQSFEPRFNTNLGGQVKIKSAHQEGEDSIPLVFSTDFMFKEAHIMDSDNIPISSFTAEGNPIVFFKDPNTGHCPWDLDCTCDLCINQDTDGDDNPSNRKRKNKKKSSQKKLRERYEAGDPEVDLLGYPSGKFDFYVLYPREGSNATFLESAPQEPKAAPRLPSYKKSLKWVKKKHESSSKSSESMP